MHSDTINELAGALAKAQGQMRAASKDAKNPHLGNTYATLSSIIEASKEPLSANGLAFSQILSQSENGLVLETLLMHSSGQWLQSEVLVTAQASNRGVNEVQQLGSSLTYYKRYALTAILGISISDEDDDGNGAAPPARQERRQQEPKQEAPTNGENSSLHWSQDKSNQKAMSAKLNEKGIPLEALFQGNSANDWTGLVTVKTGKQAFDKAVAWWEANKPDEAESLSPELQEALNGIYL